MKYIEMSKEEVTKDVIKFDQFLDSDGSWNEANTTLSDWGEVIEIGNFKDKKAYSLSFRLFLALSKSGINRIYRMNLN